MRARRLMKMLYPRLEAGSQHWTQYLFIGGVALAASWVVTTLSGCRFGNHVEKSPRAEDPITGYYATQPQSLKYCHHSITEKDSICSDVATNYIPDDIALVMSNPVALVLDSSSEALAIIPYYNIPMRDENLMFTIDIASDGSLGSTRSGVLDPNIFDSTCEPTLSFEEFGKYTQKTGITVPTFTQSIKGRLAITYEVTKSYGKDCSNALQIMALCYDDPTKCGGAGKTQNEIDGNNAYLNAYVKDLFAPYLDAKVMSVDDIATTKALSYKVSYE